MKAPKQFLWEIWFISSICVFIMFLILGSMSGSREFLHNYPYWMTGVIINLLLCIYIGITTKTDE